MTDISWINVADTAVKVGLGALIAGGFGALNAWHNHRKERYKDFSAKRRELIESVLHSVDDFSSEVAILWAMIMNGVYKRNKNELESDEEAAIDQKEKEVFEKFTEINSSKLKLLLINEKECHDMLHNYRESAADFFKTSSFKNDSLTQDSVKGHQEKMQKSRDAFFERLSIAYRDGA